MGTNCYFHSYCYNDKHYEYSLVNDNVKINIILKFYIG